MNLLKKVGRIGGKILEIDDKLNDMSKNKAFREVLNWKGFLGSWDVDMNLSPPNFYSKI